MSTPLTMFFAMLVLLLSFTQAFTIDQAIMASSLHMSQRSTQAFLNYSEAVRYGFLHAGRRNISPYQLSHASLCGSRTPTECTGKDDVYLGAGVHLFDLGFHPEIGPFFPGFAVDSEGTLLMPENWQVQPVGNGFTGEEALTYGFSNILDTDPLNSHRYNLLIWGTNLPDGGHGILTAYGKGARMGFKTSGAICAALGTNSCIQSHNFPDALFPISDNAARLIPDGTIVSLFKPIPDLPHE